MVFCSSGTEAVNLAVLGAGRRLAPGRSIITWAHEHGAVLGAARQLAAEGHPLHVLPADPRGFADPSRIPDDAGLISIGMANNELGTLQPVTEVARAARSVGALLHVDCCQGPRWTEPPVDVADLASFSGAKVGAGPGGLLLAGSEVRLQPLVFGGPQEWGWRAGHEDAPAAAALAAALQVCGRERAARSAAVAPLAARLRECLTAAGACVTGAEPRLPNYATAAFGNRRGEDLLMELDLAGIAASSGSVCASGSLDPSHVLLAIGLSMEQALGSLRLTCGYETTEADVARAAEVCKTWNIETR